MSVGKSSFYAVNKGRNPGVYTSWAQCALQVDGFSGAIYKKFRTRTEAVQFAAVAQNGLEPTEQTSPRRVIVVESGEWDTVVCEACRNEDDSVGVGVWWGENDPRNISERCPGLEAPDRGELVAVARALENLPSGNRSLLIKTTSLRCIDHIQKCVEIMKAEGQAEGVTLLNMPLSVYLPRLLARVRRQGRRIRFQHVIAATAAVEPGVQHAKALAVLGAELEGCKRVWRLKEDVDGSLDLLHMSMASLEIEA